MPILAAAGAVAGIKKGIEVGKKVVEVVKSAKNSNGPFNKFRENVQTLFRAEQGGIPLNKPDKIIDKFIIKYKTDPHNVPKEKIGATYNAEYGRLWDAVLEGITELRGPKAGEDFRQNVVRWTNDDHATDYLALLTKGAGTNAVKDIQQDKYSILAPYMPVMISSLKSKGVAVPTIKGQPLSAPMQAMLGVSENPDIEGTTQLFYNNFVAQKSNFNFENYEPIDFTLIHPGNAKHLEPALIDATIAFIKSIQDQKNKGVVLPAVLDKVGAAANNVQEKLTEKAKETVATEIGGSVMKNSTVIIAVAVVVLIVIVALIARK